MSRRPLLKALLALALALQGLELVIRVLYSWGRPQGWEGVRRSSHALLDSLRKMSIRQSLTAEDDSYDSDEDPDLQDVASVQNSASAADDLLNQDPDPFEDAGPATETL